MVSLLAIGANMKVTKHHIQRIKINGQVIGIRVIIIVNYAQKHSKQYVVNDSVTEAEALQMARDYVEMVMDKPVTMPNAKEVIAAAEDVVQAERLRALNNERVRESVVKDVSFALRRYATTSVYGYYNSLGEWSE